MYRSRTSSLINEKYRINNTDIKSVIIDIIYKNYIKVYNILFIPLDTFNGIDDAINDSFDVINNAINEAVHGCLLVVGGEELIL